MVTTRQVEARPGLRSGVGRQGELATLGDRSSEILQEKVVARFRA